MTVSEQIIQVIDALCEKFGIVIDWTSENVIPYIEILFGKLITYEIVISSIHIITWLAISIGFIALAKKLHTIVKNEKEDEGIAELLFILTVIVTIIANAIGISVIISQIMDIVKCIVFPELYAFEYVQNLLT